MTKIGAGKVPSAAGRWDLHISELERPGAQRSPQEMLLFTPGSVCKAFPKAPHIILPSGLSSQELLSFLSALCQGQTKHLWIKIFLFFWIDHMEVIAVWQLRNAVP